MSFPVRLLESREADRVGEVCRVLGLDGVEDLRVGDEAVSVRAQPVLRRPARPGAASALLVPAIGSEVAGTTRAAVRLAGALHGTGRRAVGLLPRTSCRSPGAGSPQLAGIGAQDLDLELLLDLGPAPAEGSAGPAWTGWSTALEPRLAVDDDGNPAMVGPGLGCLVGGSVLGERLAMRCVDWVLVPCGPGPLGVHHAIELRGRRIGRPPAAVVLHSGSGELSPLDMQAIRVARLHGLEVVVWSESDVGEQNVADASDAGASLVRAGRSATAAIADWLASIRAVGAGAGCFLGARSQAWESRLRAVVERVLGKRLDGAMPEFVAEVPESAELFCSAAGFDDSSNLVAVRGLRWLGEVGVLRIELGPAAEPQR